MQPDRVAALVELLCELNCGHVKSSHGQGRVFLSGVKSLQLGQSATHISDVNLLSESLPRVHGEDVTEGIRGHDARRRPGKA